MHRENTSSPAVRLRPGEGGPTTTSAGRPRIAALDVVRGFALCGILLANVQPIAATGAFIARSAPGGDEAAWLGLLVEQRFFPIFSLLFGVGFSLLLDSAAARTARPRVVLLRRLLALLALGAAHFVLLWHGDILSTYAAIGLLVLLPSTWLPRLAVAALAPVFIAVSLFVGGDRLVLIAGLFLLGSALVRCGVIDRLERSARVPAVLALVLAAAAAPVLWLQTRSDPVGRDFSISLAGAGLLIAGVYVCVLLVALRTPLRPVLQTVFAPLGRMALTNYLSATVLVLVAGLAIGSPPHTWVASTVLLIAGVILAVQWVWSTLWLRRYRQGPLEWLWRWATWARRPPLLRE
ncbi:DUF418 domain-containing protein [Microbispora hainanensis]|uniref:DUF418 domain-containing protein n=1 Tax=Microbispora hainanensis TaxID=568844 RepID=A0A544YL23_9ACTN|nr:DUF418 domain-containing protein [Microbispora hainanensis]TQS17475.1 DUF418 domain-containing protein [Microbispora hainanensis]